MDAGTGKSRDFGLSKPLPARWSKRVLPQQPQVMIRLPKEFRFAVVTRVYLRDSLLIDHDR